jgi:hypothetical protein
MICTLAAGNSYLTSMSFDHSFIFILAFSFWCHFPVLGLESTIFPVNFNSIYGRMVFWNQMQLARFIVSRLSQNRVWKSMYVYQSYSYTTQVFWFLLLFAIVTILTLAPSFPLLCGHIINLSVIQLSSFITISF